ncbi:MULTISPECIES: laminin G [unclassified Streptomyces]|uniref:laminin G n=1 Tax=unclassified Streptomyces TaxID=2593676 RepID=UPI003821BEF5
MSSENQAEKSGDKDIVKPLDSNRPIRPMDSNRPIQPMDSNRPITDAALAGDSNRPAPGEGIVTAKDSNRPIAEPKP